MKGHIQDPKVMGQGVALQNLDWDDEGVLEQVTGRAGEKVRIVEQPFRTVTL